MPASPGADPPTAGVSARAGAAASAGAGAGLGVGPLRGWLQSAAPPLYPVPLYPGPLACALCRGLARHGFARCYQCERHVLLGRGQLADAVVPISYAVRGTAFADDLWRYKSRPVPSATARASVLALLVAFLADHGRCVWRHAGMPPPSGLAVVPTGLGRPGPHPLQKLVGPFLRLTPCVLDLQPGHQGRELDPDRYRATGVPPGASVLLVDDTWVSGASAQSAAVALKRAGARQVAVVVAGRHINPADPRAAPLVAGLAPARYDWSSCAVPHVPHALSEMVRTGGKRRAPVIGIIAP